MMLKSLINKIITVSILLSLTATLCQAMPSQEDLEGTSKYTTIKRAVIALSGAAVIGGLWWYYNQDNDDNGSGHTRSLDMCYSEDNICPESIPTQLFTFVKQNGEIVMSELQKCFWEKASFYHSKCFSSSDEPVDLGFNAKQFTNKIVSLMETPEEYHVRNLIFSTNGDCRNSVVPCRASQWTLQLSEVFNNATNTICSYSSYFSDDSLAKTEMDHRDGHPYTLFFGKISLLLKQAIR